MTPAAPAAVWPRRAFDAVRARPAEAWCAAALFAWLLALGALLPLDADEGVYTVVAQGMLDGRWPYRDLFDHKQPLLYVLYLPSAVASIEVQRAIAALCAAASVPAFGALARRWLDAPHAPAATLAYALLLANPQIGVVRNAEAFLLLPVLLALLAPGALLAGALLGIAVATKSVALLYLPLVLWRWRRDVPRLALGFAAPLAVCAIALAPVAGDAWTANVAFNREYAAADGGARLAAAFAFDPAVLWSSLPLWLAAAAGLVLCRSPRVFALAALSILAVKAPGYDFTHYYALLAPAASMLAAIALVRGWSFLRQHDGPLPVRAARATLVAGVALSVAIALALSIAGVVYLAANEDPFDDVARAARAHPGEIYVLGEKGQVYVLADRMPERRFFTSIPLVVRDDWGDAARRDLLACPPDVLITIEDAPLFDIPWQHEVVAIYAEREQFEHGTVHTAPSKPCSDSTR